MVLKNIVVKNPYNLFKTLLFILISVSGIILVKKYGVNVFFWDEWSMLETFERFDKSTLTFNDLFRQYNEHRLFFPSIIMLFFGKLSNYDTRFLMYFSQGILLLTEVFLVIKVYNSGLMKNNGKLKLPLWLLLIPYFIFHFHQSESFLWGIQIGFLLVFTNLIFSLFFLDLHFQRNSGFKYLILSIVFAIISSFSSSHGLLIWVCGLFYLVANNYWKRGNTSVRKFLKYENCREILIWLCFGIGAWFLYLHDYKKPAWHPETNFALYHPILGLEYLLTLAGGITRNLDFALIFGALLFIGSLVLIIAVVKLDLLKDNIFWLSISLFSVLFGLMTTVGRTGFGANQAMASRYVTYFVPALISCVVLFIQVSNRLNNYEFRMFGAGLAIVFVLCTIPQKEFFEHIESGKEKRIIAVNSILSGSLDNTEVILSGDRKILEEKLKFLKANNYNLFKNTTKEVLVLNENEIKSGKFNYEVINGSFKNGSLSADYDSQFIIGYPPSIKHGEYEVFLEFEAFNTQNDLFQVFFDRKNNYSEKNSMFFELNEGENNLNFKLPADKFGGKLRFDFGNNQKTCNLKYVKIVANKWNSLGSS